MLSYTCASFRYHFFIALNHLLTILQSVCCRLCHFLVCHRVCRYIANLFLLICVVMIRRCPLPNGAAAPLAELDLSPIHLLTKVVLVRVIFVLPRPSLLLKPPSPPPRTNSSSGCRKLYNNRSAPWPHHPPCCSLRNDHSLCIRHSLPPLRLLLPPHRTVSFSMLCFAG